MSTYAIGDIQGCFATLQALLKKINFNRRTDTLWFVGDLVNRGASSLAVLRFVRDLGERAITVLGNHDLHLLALAAGATKGKAGDTLAETLAARDCDELLTWLRGRPLLHVAERYAMVHAGLHPAWDWASAKHAAFEIETALCSPDYVTLLGNMYGDEPTTWSAACAGAASARHRFVMNVMTRMRVLTKAGALDLKFKGEADAIPDSHEAWFDAPSARTTDQTLLVGHWSALGLRVSPSVVSLDTGCVWGRTLTAFRLEDGAIIAQAAVEPAAATGRD